MTAQKGAVQALRLTLPGASHTWHFLSGIPGLYHPDYAVPLDTLGVSEEQAKKWSKADGCPITLEQTSKADADSASEAYLEATGAAVAGVRQAAASVPPGAAGLVERGRVSEHIDALKGKDAGAVGDQTAGEPAEPKEG